MTIADIVQVNVSISGGASPSRQGFGTPMIAAYHENYADRIRFYSSASALADMVTDGFSTTEPAFRAMEVALAQDPTPPLIAIGRRASFYTQVLVLTLTSVVTSLDSYKLTIVSPDGVQHTLTLPSTGVPTTDTASLATLIGAIGGAIGTVTHAGSTITITQAVATLNDIIDWSGNIHIADTTADPGIAADLTAIRAANNLGWYSVSLDSNSPAEILAAQAWVESTGQGGKVGFYNTSDYAAGDGASNTDVFALAQSRSYNKCLIKYSGRQLLDYSGFGAACELLAKKPGSYQAAFKSIAGVLADNDQTLTETRQLVINTCSTSQPGTGGKNGNWYKTVSGINILFPGVTPKGQWIDVIIFLDWLQANMQADVFAVLAGLDVVPFTDFGIGLIADAVKTRLKIGASPPYGGIDPDGATPITVTVPLAASISPTDKQARNLPGLSWKATLSGGIVTTEIQGTLVP